MEHLTMFPGLIPMPLSSLYFKSVQDYNRLKVDINFYKKFDGFQYLLTYELDAYIFSNEFESINVFDYDYTGAPFFEGYADATTESLFIQGGNSGFSMRNIQACIQGLTVLSKYRKKWKLQFFFIRKLPFFKSILKKVNWRYYELFINDHFIGYMRGGYFNEDVLLSRLLPIIYPSFKVANPLQAMRFSFEVNPEKLLEMNNNDLPLGCHAWPRYTKFWSKYINSM
ncbi:DUF5672 family protein [Parapedobacter tibetensis]|nr:DUF5672 family protein [Parapedobacter tibetensis]